VYLKILMNSKGVKIGKMAKATPINRLSGKFQRFQCSRSYNETFENP
jgi:hypothetical protein